MDTKDFIFGKEAIITLSHEHSLMLPHIPVKASLREVQNKLSKSFTKETIKSFGLFGDVPDYNTFYPGLEEADWLPKEGEFIEPLFRFFSETTVLYRGIPIDFSTDNVIKNSIPLLLGATVYPDHEAFNVGNALGAISRVEWQEEREVNGIKIPAGINGTPKIDAKSNPRIARAIMMNPPAIHSTSVTVRFEWEKSHPDLEDFWNKLGSYDKDGNMVRLIATRVKSYSELSLVPHGADPYAQAINEDGDIINPEYAERVYDFSAKNAFSTDCGLNFKGVCTIKNSSSNKPNKNTKNMDLKELLTSLGLSSEEFKTLEDVKAYFVSLKEERDSLLEFKTSFGEYTIEKVKALEKNQLPEGAQLLNDEDKSLLDSIKATFGEEVPDFAQLKEQAEQGSQYLATLKKEAEKYYKLVAGETPDSTILDTIEKANLSQAKSFKELYFSLADAKAPLTCQDCGSTHVSRSTPSPNEGNGNSSLTFDDIKKKAKKAKGRKPHTLHG